MSASNLTAPFRPMLMGGDIAALIVKIEQWGEARNITPEGGATIEAQLKKLQEELNEGFDTLEELDTNARLTFHETVELRTQLDADFGDMLVCIIQAMRLANTDMIVCLEKAWEDIKDRKGTMVDGQFVKES